MIGRVIRDITTSVHRNHRGLTVMVTTKWCESNIGGGEIRSKTDTYEAMTDEECIDVLEAVAWGLLPGSELEEEMTLFVLQ